MLEWGACEDPVYRVLAKLDPQGCRTLIDDGWFARPFETGERSVHWASCS